ncbi:DUF2207 domain-containing protein [Limosilactobacillus sp. STM2_1]|uniref:DUF2207 domain-containing protein n=1 Tax=Limosilactobacillus rudii TaxID=2759755 RepID=A0A7W3UMR9_9LACO|nr:DUF2207 domain-containing protein [Limosilactobacillus rudii]MBB1080417.1 DUF2207 domain-containing protein [Limosilactobacillus rudii]MBB1098443.1 DUF2207 domain-containing protein [Limosilactobacillus rudii]MCD7135451.1 DUF2207 domain-containing protein [Limosilactobacillus rudii]
MQLTKNKQSMIILIVLTVLFGISSLKKVAASDNRDYQIKQNDIYVKINRNGSADVTQQVHYQFKGKYHGVFIVQDTKGLGKISQIQVAKDNLPIHQLLESPDLYFTQAANIGQSDQILSLNDHLKFNAAFYQPNTDADGEKAKGDYRIVSSVPSENKQVITYHYHLSAVAKRYLDTGEINWKIIGRSWQRELQQVRITIVMPAARGQQSLWVHGAKYEHKVWNRHTATISLTAADVNQYLEIHLLFPKEAIDKAPLHASERVAIAQKKERRIGGVEQFFIERHPINYLIVAVSLMIPFGIYGLYWLIYNRQNLIKRDHISEHLHRFALPSLPPVQAASIYQASLREDTGMIPLATELAALQLAGNIKVEGEQIKWEKGTAEDSKFIYFLTHNYGDENNQVSLKQVRNDNDNTLYNHWLSTKEKWSSLGGKVNPAKASFDKFSCIYFLGVAFIAFLCSRLVTNGFSIGLLIGALVRISEIMIIGVGLSVWQPFEKIKQLLFRKYDFKISYCLYSYVLGLIVCILLYIAASFDHNISSIFGLGFKTISQPIIVGVLICGLGLQGLNALVDYHYVSYSKKQYQDLTEVLQFKQMIHDIGRFNKKQLPDQALWGEYYVYATAVGETSEFIRGLEKQFGAKLVAKNLDQQLQGFSANEWEVQQFANRIISNSEAKVGNDGSESSFDNSSGGWGSSGGAGGDSGGGAF